MSSDIAPDALIARVDGTDPPPGESTQRARGGLARALMLWCVPLVAVVAGVVWYGRGGTVAATDNAYVKQDRIDVTPYVSGDVRDVRAVENAPVAAGDIVLLLDDAPLRVAEREAAAGLANARLSVDATRAEYRAKSGEVALARRSAQYAVREYDRQSELAVRKLVTQTALDESHRVADAATGDIAMLELQLSEVRARLGGNPDIRVDEHPAVMSAAAQLEKAQVDVARAVVRAPRAGIVSHLPQVGDHVVEGKPAFAIVTNGAVWIEANFKETDLGWVRPGQPARVTVDLYPGRRWTGTVQSVAQATGSEFSIIPAQNASGNWVKVVQRIPVRIAMRTSPQDPPLRSGASALVEIDTDAPTRMRRWLERWM